MSGDINKMIDLISCRRAFFDLLKGKSVAVTTPEHQDIVKNLQQTNGCMRNENGRIITSGDNEFVYFSSTVRYEGGKAKLISSLDVGYKGREKDVYTLSWTVTGTPKGNEDCCNPAQLDSVDSITTERYKGRTLLNKMNLLVESPDNRNLDEAEILKRYLGSDAPGIDVLLQDKNIREQADKIFADMRRDSLKNGSSRTVVRKDSRER